jgi:hypothetical protein
MPNPSGFVEHLREHGYNPRSDRHSNVLAACVVGDLVRHCSAIRESAAEGAVVYDLNFTLLAGTSEWKVDLVIGEPGIGPREHLPAGEIRCARPSRVQIAVEFKSVMTEHRKAIKNRKRDFEAHHDHVHRYSDRAIAGGILVLNGSARFRSPLRSATSVHKEPAKLVQHCIAQMRSVSMRSAPGAAGLDAKCAIVVDFDNENLAAARFLDAPPAPAVGDPLHYDAFIQTLCDLYAERFAP